MEVAITSLSQSGAEEALRVVSSAWSSHTGACAPSRRVMGRMRTSVMMWEGNGCAWRLKRSGDRELPWGQPLSKAKEAEVAPLTHARPVMPDKKNFCPAAAGVAKAHLPHDAEDPCLVDAVERLN